MTTSKNGVQYSKTEGSESALRIFSRMKVTNNPYHLETEGTVKQTALLNYGATTADEIETDFQVISDEKDGMNHVNYGNETKDFEYSYCPTLNPELFEGIANGSIEAKYGEGDDGLKAALNWLYLDVNVSGEALKNFFLDEEK